MKWGVDAGDGRLALILSLAALTIPVAVLVNRIVPGVYLDEEFHVRQVQHYCRGNFDEWDPKITTFPGLYMLSLLYTGALLPVGLLFGIRPPLVNLCQPAVLRSVNIVLSVICALLFREIIYLLDPDKNKLRASAKALVLSLYPLHWFFNFLYYTELGSATAVMALYLASLKHAFWSSALFGAISILIRQTNVVWVFFVLCVGVLDFIQNGLDWKKSSQHQDNTLVPREGKTDTCTAPSEFPVPGEQSAACSSNVENVLSKDGMRKRRLGGQVTMISDDSHEIALKPLVQGFVNDGILREVLALVKSVWLRRNDVLWSFGPLLLVILSFMGFVLRNGSIVVGDKSAHKVSPHLAQLLYCGLVCAGFHASRHCNPYNLSQLFKALKTSSKTMCLTCFITAVAAAFIAVQFFSAAHPYLLADNRHYTFYLWKDVMQRHWSLKYMFIPFYMLSWFSILFMLGQTQKVLWVTAYFLAVVGVLVPAPLLEFRYYNVPFYLMFLHSGREGPLEKYSLFVTALQFMAVNVVTIYIFLYWPFAWPSEPGKLQRFMW